MPFSVNDYWKVQLPEKLIVYELSTDAKSGDMTYFVKVRVYAPIESCVKNSLALLGENNA